MARLRPPSYFDSMWNTNTSKESEILHARALLPYHQQNNIKYWNPNDNMCMDGGKMFP